MEYTTHVVVMDGSKNLFQANSEGNLIPWNGALQSLEAVTPVRRLGERETFDMLSGVSFSKLGLSDTSINIFVAYRMLETGELVYSASPITLFLGQQ